LRETGFRRLSYSGEVGAVNVAASGWRRITGIFVFGEVFFPRLTKRSQVERGQNV